MNKSDLLINDLCSYFEKKIIEKESFTGVNGPHNHNMTSARVYSHIAIIFAYRYSITKNMKFYNLAVYCIDYLLCKEIFIEKRYFKHREEPGKTDSNGLIGQMWTIEALIYCSKKLCKLQYKNIALKVWRHHKFDSSTSMWRQINLCGSKLGPIDYTLNQQIWTYAMGTLLSNDLTETERQNLNDFLDMLDRSIDLECKILPLSIFKRNTFESIKFKLSLIKHGTYNSFYERETCYHIFSLCGLVIGIKYLDKHPLKMKLNKLLEVTKKDKFIKKLRSSDFGFHYNVPGFELYFINRSIENSLPIAVELFEEQISILNQYIDEKTIKNVDFITLLSRGYELVRCIDNVNEEDVE